MAIPNIFDHYVRVRPAPGCSDVTTMEMVVAASQTIKAGDILKISSGQVVQAITAPSAGTSTLSGAAPLVCVGVALGPITTDATGYEAAGGMLRNKVNVAIFDDRLNVLLRTAGTNGASKTLSNITVGTAYQFGRFTNAGGTDSWYFLSDTSTGTAPEMKFEEATADYQGTSNTFPTVWVKLIASARQMG